MSELNKNTPVYLASCDSYDTEKLYNILRDSFSAIGVAKEEISGKKVTIKANLVLAKKPDFGATTHPATVNAVVKLLDEMGAASITLADSPGGPFNAANLSNVYRVCELAPLESDKLHINDDFTWQNVHIGGEKLKNGHCITPVYEADVIIDLCKLKTHSLTTLSAATKNLFGTIPGVEKFEMHSTFPKVNDFSAMLVDLGAYYSTNKTFIAICDGILSMEGNGPTHGVAKKTDLMLISRSPFALDVIAEHIIGADNEVVLLNQASERGLVERDWKNIELLGETECPTFKFERPDTEAGKFLKNLPNMFGGRLAKFFETRPKIMLDKCVGCGKCVSSCPRHTISLVEKKGKKKAQINHSNCIRCYCCQELCPIGAVGTKQNIFIKLIH